MGSPAASVIVRTRDSAATLEATCRSVRDQDVPCEVVVVDSGSTDATLELAGRLADQVVQVPGHDFSYGGALNRGAGAAGAPVLVSLSSHCALPRPDWVRIAVDHVEAGAVAACGAVAGPTGRPLVEPVRADGELLRAHRYWGFTNHASAWSAEVWDETPFDEALPATEDKEWSWRAVTGERYLVVDPRLVVPGDHRRTPGVRSYFHRLVKEQVAVHHLRPLPRYGAGEVVRDLRRPSGTAPYLSAARPLGRTRAVEVSARWYARRVVAQREARDGSAEDRRATDAGSGGA